MGMDTSPAYIEMCQMAPEVQSQWKPEVGDHCLEQGRRPRILADSPSGTLPSTIWLPRQDQLQRLLGADKPREFMASCHAIATHPRWFDTAETPEQIWLILLMRELYHKSWAGVIWDDI